MSEARPPAADGEPADAGESLLFSLKAVAAGFAQSRRQRERLLADLMQRVARQDASHPEGYATNRDGIRLAIAAIEDETREALEAWGEERRCRTWAGVRDELLDVAAVALRALHAIDRDEVRTELVATGRYVPTDATKESSRAGR